MEALQILAMVWGVVLVAAAAIVALDNEQGERMDWKATAERIKAAVAKVTASTVGYIFGKIF